MNCAECDVLGSEVATKWRLYQSAVIEYLRDPTNREAAKRASRALETAAQARLAKDAHRIDAHGWKLL